MRKGGRASGAHLRADLTPNLKESGEVRSGCGAREQFISKQRPGWKQGRRTQISTKIFSLLYSTPERELLKKEELKK